MSACIGSSLLNTSIIYTLFVQPIYAPAVAAVVCNPLFFLPSLVVNYMLFARYYPYFYHPRSHVINLYLKPNGKQVIVETRDGESKTVNNMDFFNPKAITSKYQHRIEVHHGANNFLFITGNSYVYDAHMLSAALSNNFIDVKNVAYDYDLTKEFTWDFKELVEIKKRKRVLNRFYKPSVTLLQRMTNAKKFEQSKKQGALMTSR